MNVAAFKTHKKATESKYEAPKNQRSGRKSCLPSRISAGNAKFLRRVVPQKGVAARFIHGLRTEAASTWTVQRQT